ncbi:hypothetical protein D9758_008093 [Tetrapyrgos nigripes]|uniref:Uncharacterized protein n=1 Tax=Tetrapyrgos nigripes TaxID=182062 RepID=A0A8H5GHP9_9AGAR|nr:hypothetical protein D9758_008093 [Tetrapyrgos nigripes]
MHKNFPCLRCGKNLRGEKAYIVHRDLCKQNIDLTSSTSTSPPQDQFTSPSSHLSSARIATDAQRIRSFSTSASPATSAPDPSTPSYTSFQYGGATASSYNTPLSHYYPDNINTQHQYSTDHSSAIGLNAGYSTNSNLFSSPRLSMPYPSGTASSTYTSTPTAYGYYQQTPPVLHHPASPTTSTAFSATASASYPTSTSTSVYHHQPFNSQYQSTMLYPPSAAGAIQQGEFEGLNQDDGNTSKSVVFEEVPGLEAWRRFERLYSHRVRHLDLAKLRLNEYYCILMAMASTRPPSSSKIFPNLREMTIRGSGLLHPTGGFETIVQFMHERIESFSLYARDEGKLELGFPSMFIMIVKAIGDYMPRLTSLVLGHNFSWTFDHRFTDAMAICCSRLPALVKLDLGPLVNEPDSYAVVIESAVRNCPCLETVTVANLGFFPSSAVPMPMPSLKRLEVEDCVAIHTLHLLQQHPMPSLQELDLSWNYQSPAERASLAKYQSLVMHIVTSFPQLTKLNFNIPVDFELTFDVFRPLLQLSSLSSLYFIEATIPFTDEDLGFLGRCLPALEFLDLWCARGPTLQGLSNLAEHALKLRSLDLVILPIHPAASNINSDQGPTMLTPGSLSSMNKFRCLEHLSLGYSHLHPKWTIVVLEVLGYMLPLQTEGLDHDLSPAVIQSNKEEWEKVISGLRNRDPALS